MHSNVLPSASPSPTPTDPRPGSIITWHISGLHPLSYIQLVFASQPWAPPVAIALGGGKWRLLAEPLPQWNPTHGWLPSSGEARARRAYFAVAGVWSRHVGSWQQPTAFLMGGKWRRTLGFGRCWVSQSDDLVNLYFRSHKKSRRFSVVLGKNALNESDSSKEQMFKVEEIIVHEGFDNSEGNFNNDIGKASPFLEYTCE